jgi:hypothetical protein
MFTNSLEEEAWRRGERGIKKRGEAEKHKKLRVAV